MVKAQISTPKAGFFTRPESRGRVELQPDQSSASCKIPVNLEDVKPQELRDYHSCEV